MIFKYILIFLYSLYICKIKIHNYLKNQYQLSYKYPDALILINLNYLLYHIKYLKCYLAAPHNLNPIKV